MEKIQKQANDTHTPLDERTCLTLHEMEDMYQSAWETGYKSACQDRDRVHNEQVEYVGLKR